MPRLLFLLLFISIISCNPISQKQTNQRTEIPEEAGKYISSYTPQLISVDQNISVRFSGAVVEPDEVGKEADPTLVHLEPKTAGNAYWEDMQTLVFDPAEKLPYDTDFDLVVKLESLFSDLDKNLRTIRIPYKTKALQFQLEISDLDYGPGIGQNNIQADGILHTTDAVDTETLEKMVKVSQKGNKDISIQWLSHSNEVHRFSIDRIKRLEEASTLLVEWDFSKFNVTGSSQKDFSGAKKIPILAVGQFSLIGSEAISGSAKSIKLSFSDVLDPDQDLTGLIRIDGHKGSLKIEKLGSKVNIYPDNSITGPFVLKIDNTVKRKANGTLDQNYSIPMAFDPVKPMVRLLGKGVIVPYTSELIFPFEAINLNSVDVEVFKIFQDNVLQFLQYNQLDDQYSLEPVGRIIHQQHVSLTQLDPSSNEFQFVRYVLDLSPIVKLDPGAIYQVRIGFSRKDLANYPCDSPPEAEPAALVDRDGFTSIFERSIEYDYDYRERNNPCSPSYYRSNVFAKRNVLASNIAAIAKRNMDGSFVFQCTDVRTLEVLADVQISLYDFQQQLIAKGMTDTGGYLKNKPDGKAAFAILKSASAYSYINLQDQYANSLSEFDVSGTIKRDGIDGYIYGERGVWRPGDTLFLTFVLEDKQKQLPQGHPVSFELIDALGKARFKTTTSKHVGQMYPFTIPTLSGDPTGNWRAIAGVGNLKFEKNLKIETVKPNRLKVELDIPDERIELYKNQSVSFQSSWLHGAPADGLKAKVDLQLKPVATKFSGFKDFNFDDPARALDPVPFTVFDGFLDAEGKTTIQLKAAPETLAPGKLKASLHSKVFEKGGNFSEDHYTVDADLYEAYVGVSIPKTRWGYKFIEQDKPTNIPIVSVDRTGKPLAGRSLKVGIYEAEWNWWYERRYNNRYEYNSAQHTGALEVMELKTDKDGKANYLADFDDYGNYMIRICDEVSGHCTGDLFYTGYSWSSFKEDQEGPSQLVFTSDKEAYAIGETIQLTVPSNVGAKLFVSLENGSSVIRNFWLDANDELTKFEIPVNRELESTTYIHIHLIQPHNQGENELPIRMYGVKPVRVIDPATKLDVAVKMPEVLEPNSTFEVEISETKGKAMSYTLSMVDEGLLSLTRFKTPALWDHFYAKQALNVKTWDMYDYFLNGYGGNVDRYISIGGDGTELNPDAAKEANRFKPVVRHLGPFYLEKGKKAKHKIEMPNYVGAVRVMAVARAANAYGSASKTVQVKKPLMLQATLPRVLGPMEHVFVPANIFAMDASVKNVDVSITVSPNIKIIGDSRKSISFDRIGDKMSFFEIEVGEETGIAQIKLEAKSGKEKAFDEIEIQIRNPNPFTSEVTEITIEPGEIKTLDYAPFGTPGTNEAVAEFSQIPPMNFMNRLHYLIRYPYGCIEQTTSSVFPQLYLDKIMDLKDKEKWKTQANIKRGIERLSLFQLPGGGFSYWPGQRSVSDWGTIYAGHFLLEAKAKGYLVPKFMIDDMLNYMSRTAGEFNFPQQISKTNSWEIRTQAYRLYVLALGAKPNLAAMNRLRNLDKLDITSSHMLAAAYAILGKKDIALQMLTGGAITVEPYLETGHTYGSHIRDLAMISEALLYTDKREEGAKVIQQISSEMNSSRWHATQTVAYSLLSIGKFLQSYDKGNMVMELNHAGEKLINFNTSKPLLQVPLEINSMQKKSLTIKNTSNSILFVKLVLSGQKAPGDNQTASNQHIKMDLKYSDMEGNSVDPSALTMGKDFKAEVTIQNMGGRYYNIDEMALSQIFPSGWEILNTRLSGVGDLSKDSPSKYRNYRDDRVYTFFDIRGTGNYKYTVLLNASYAGRFYLPPVSAEAMYDNEVQANSAGYWVNVLQN